MRHMTHISFLAVWILIAMWSGMSSSGGEAQTIPAYILKDTLDLFILIFSYSDEVNYTTKMISYSCHVDN